MILESYYNTTCTYVLQGDPLHMGVPTRDVSSLLWLLLLQCDAVSSADTAPLLGCSHLTHVFQVHLQQGVFLFVWMYQDFVAHLWLTLFLPLLLCGSSSFCSWKAMTGAMKRRKTVTHRRKETTNAVTWMALVAEAEPMATDTYRQKERK